MISFRCAETGLVLAALLVGRLMVDATPASAAEPEKNWVFSLATIAPANSTYMKVLKEATDRLEQKSRGQIRFKLYLGGVLGDEPEMVSKVRKGELSAGIFSVSGIGEMSPEFAVLFLPFLFRNEKEIDYVRGKMSDRFIELFRGKGFELMAWADIGFAQVFSKVPLQNVHDFKQRHLWAWPGEKVLPVFADFLGLKLNPIPLPGVLDALREGKIDTVYVNALGAVVLGWYREVDYVMKWDGMYGAAVLVAGRNQWMATPEGVRNMIMEEVRATLPKMFEVVRRDEETALKGISKRGVRILQPDAKAIGEFRTLAEQFARKYVEGKPDLQKVLDEVMHHLQEYRSSTARLEGIDKVYLASKPIMTEHPSGITPTHPSPLGLLRRPSFARRSWLREGGSSSGCEGWKGEGEGGGGVSSKPGLPIHMTARD